MAEICATVLAKDKAEYDKQMNTVVDFAHRVQIDLTDGMFAETETIRPEAAWWPVGVRADFHLMYKNPVQAVKAVMEHKPNLIIVHAEAEGGFSAFANFCHRNGVRAGVALLPETPAETILPALEMVDHVLIFSGSLGSFGGTADLKLLNKSSILKSHKPELEIGWDGGINLQNASELVSGGIDVLNVGGFIQNSDNPARAFHSLQRIADETGTT